jgi:hypothetical protein
MTAANVATRPSVGRSWGSGPVGAIALTIGLVAGLAVGALALRPAATATQAVAPRVAPTTYQAHVGPMAGHPAAAPAQSPLVNYTRVVANVKAAESRHDFAARYRFERQLRATLTAQTIGLVYQERSRLMERLAEAKSTGNGYAVYRIGDDLDALCGPAAVKSLLTFC